MHRGETIMNEEEESLARCLVHAIILQRYLNKVFGFDPKETTEYFVVEVCPAPYLTSGVSVAVNLFFVADGSLCKKVVASLGEEDFETRGLYKRLINDITLYMGLKPIEELS